MVVILVALLFLVAVIIDSIISSKKMQELAEGVGSWTGYHPKHAKAVWVNPEVAAVSLDDFGTKLVGLKSVEAPRVGSYVRKGEVGATVNGVDIVAPVSGEVIAGKDEKRGILYRVRNAKMPAELEDLMTGTIAEKFIRNSFDSLSLAVDGALPDGGEMVDDLSEALDKEKWRKLCKEFMA